VRRLTLTLTLPRCVALHVRFQDERRPKRKSIKSDVPLASPLQLVRKL
jgi:hypothetical protein